MPTPDAPSHDLARLIEVLDQHGVEYLVCGGAAAQVYGAERPTEDADCVVKRGVPVVLGKFWSDIPDLQ
jgi:hypothetical protein